METELKFEVDAAAAARLAENLALDAHGSAHSLRSVYFDTPDRRLLAKRVALRVRDDGERYVQTVKCEAGGGIHRGEWETEIAGPDPDLAAAAAGPLLSVLGKSKTATLAPAFETRVERTTRDIRRGGAVVEAALDRGVVNAGGVGQPILELELELKRGRTPALFAVARELAAVAPINLSFVSKAERGYALLAGEPLSPAKSRDPKIERDADAAAAFKSVANGALAQMAANARVLRHARRIEALHQLRVGARRLRSAISLFRPMLADDQLESIKGELKWLTHELDDARNLDVFITDSFRPAARRHADWEGMAVLGRALISAQTHAYDRAEAAVVGARFRALMIETAAWIEIGPWTLRRDPVVAALRRRPIADAAQQILERRYRKVAKRGRKLAKLEPHPRHELRIDAKKLRYACGFFGSLYSGKRLAGLVEAMEGLQDTLGAVTDIAAAGGLTAKLAGAQADHVAGAAELAFAAGLVAGERQGGTGDAVAEAERAFRRFRRAKPFWRD